MIIIDDDDDDDEFPIQIRFEIWKHSAAELEEENKIVFSPTKRRR